MKELNNNIQESYCSFEVSKLLKEKGFECNVTHYYNNHPPKNHYPRGLLVGKVIQCHNGENIGDDFICSAPTQSLAIEWVRINYGIFIESHQTYPKYNCYIKNQEYDKFRVQCVTEEFNTPQEAQLAALKYVLTELIK